MNNETIIGEIDLSSPLENFLAEAVEKFNFGKKLGICTIAVKSNEGEIPHLHIENERGFKCHICLYEPLYFEHKQGEGKLSSDQKVMLQDFLLDSHKGNPNKTNWEFAAGDWKQRNDQDGKKLERYLKNRGLDGTMPDYTTLDNSKNGTIHAPKK